MPVTEKSYLIKTFRFSAVCFGVPGTDFSHLRLSTFTGGFAIFRQFFFVTLQSCGAHPRRSKHHDQKSSTE
jgi:hypothetical protein